jgi:hypothetical protein
MPLRGRTIVAAAQLDRHEFRCEECGYGAVARIAPEFCPMCRGSVWMLASFGPDPRAPSAAEDGW